MSFPEIRFEDTLFDVRPGESILDAGLRSGAAIPFSCRGGVCHTCLLRCTEGQVPAEATRGLPEELAARNYLLACLCVPAGPMMLARPDSADRATDCLLHQAEAAGDFLFLRFETARVLACIPGQVLLLQRAADGVAEAGSGISLEVTACVPDAFMIDALVRRDQDLPAWLLENRFGHDFTVTGPHQAPAGTDEQAAPAPDPALWEALGDGLRVRAVMEDFYIKVYRDPLLAPFFAHVTMQRSIDKQYSFMRQLMTGERVYFGERPRNAHHWMIISNELFDHRQALMHDTLVEHGLSEAEIARWMRLEQHYRKDIVKDAAWPRRMGDVELALDGFDEETLLEASVCDYCHEAVESGTRVRYHLRLGKISCGKCTAGTILGGAAA